MNIRWYKICQFIEIFLLCFMEVWCQILITNRETVLCRNQIDFIGERKSIYDIKKKFEHKEMLLSSSIRAYGPGVVDVYGTYTILFSKIRLSWKDSQSFCQESNSLLIHSIDEKMNDYLKKKLERLNGNFWIGGLWISKKGFWNTTAGQESITWADWADNEPNNSGECVQMWGYVGYRWDDDKCDMKNKFICAKTDI